MKKTLWCLVALVVWGVAAYLCYHYLGLEKASYIGGTVGAAATIAAVIFAMPSDPGQSPASQTKTIHTEGDYSPGQVQGNFSVGTAHGGTANNSGASASAIDLANSIETKGRFSPGAVGGNYEVNSSSPPARDKK